MPVLTRSVFTNPMPGDVLACTCTNQWATEVTRFSVTKREGNKVWFTVDDHSFEVPVDVAEWARRRAGCEVISEPQIAAERNS